MLHTKFQGNPSIGSGEEDFSKNFTICGHDSHLGHMTLLVCINFHSHSSISFHKNLVLNDSIVSEKNKLHFF